MDTDDLDLYSLGLLPSSDFCLRLVFLSFVFAFAFVIDLYSAAPNPNPPPAPSLLVGRDGDDGIRGLDVRGHCLSSVVVVFSLLASVFCRVV
jgi:hypothetical protein